MPICRLVTVTWLNSEAVAEHSRRRQPRWGHLMPGNTPRRSRRARPAGGRHPARQLPAALAAGSWGAAVASRRATKPRPAGSGRGTPLRPGTGGLNADNARRPFETGGDVTTRRSHGVRQPSRRHPVGDRYVTVCRAIHADSHFRSCVDWVNHHLEPHGRAVVDRAQHSRC